MADRSGPAADFFGFGKTETPTTSETEPSSTTTVTGRSGPAAEFFGFDKGGSETTKTAPTGNSIWEGVKSAANQAYQGVVEGGSFLGGLPSLAQRYGFVSPLMMPGVGDSPPPTTANLLEGAQKHLGYDPTPPNDLMGELARGAGQAATTLPLGAVSGMSIPANLAYTFGPSVVGDLMHHYTGVPSWLAALPTALSMSGGERLMTQYGAKAAAEEAARAAAEKAAAAEAAAQAHQTGAAKFTRELQAQQDVSQAEAGRAKMFSEADAAKRLDSEHMAAANYLLSEHAGADADREAVASGLGQSQTVQKSGEALQDAARIWKKTDFPQQLKNAEEQMYHGAVNIPEDALGNLNQFESSLKNSFYKAGELEPVAQRLRSRLPEGLDNAISQIRKERGLTPDQPLVATLDDMRKLRSVLGDAMTSPKLTEGVDAGKMNELYRALSGDMEGAISNSAGPQGLAQFKKFNEEARRLYGLASGPVSDIISTTDKAGETIAPGDAVSAVLKGSDKDGTRLAQLASEPTLNKGLKEVAASQLRTGKGPGVTQGDPDKFFAGLAPESKTALLGDENAGKLQDAIDRRTAAEKTAGDMKTAADKSHADMLEAAGKISTASLKGQEAVRQDLREARSTEGTRLNQEAKNTAAETKIAANKLKDVTTPPKSSGYDFPPWTKALIATAGGAHAVPHLFAQQAAELPIWGQDVLSGVGGAAGYLAMKGMQEFGRDPARVSRNLLQAGASTAVANPNALGWGVSENK